MTQVQLYHAVGLLAESYRQTLSPQALTGYWLAFDGQGIDAEALEAGARGALRVDTAYMPSPGELLEHCRQAKLRNIIRTPRPEPWHVECEDCEDTGFLRRHCLGTGQDDCRFCRQYHPRDHEWVEPCSCRASNRTYQRKRERERIRPLREDKPRRDKGTTGGWSKTSARDWTAAS